VGQPLQRVFSIGASRFCLVWFAKDKQTALDHLWSASPSSAFALHTAMLRQVMATLGRLIPQVRGHGCAPLPPTSPRLQLYLKRHGIHQAAGGQLDHAYAVLTHFPWQGGCSCCVLARTCFDSRRMAKAGRQGK